MPDGSQREQITVLHPASMTPEPTKRCWARDFGSACAQRCAQNIQPRCGSFRPVPDWMYRLIGVRLRDLPEEFVNVKGSLKDWKFIGEADELRVKAKFSASPSGYIQIAAMVTNLAPLTRAIGFGFEIPVGDDGWRFLKYLSGRVLNVSACTLKSTCRRLSRIHTS
jgi:hypothetical protein